jgi:hypothetical protein
MIRSSNANSWARVGLLLGALALGLACWLYLGGPFFLALAGGRMREGTPVTLYQYWQHYGAHAQVRQWPGLAAGAAGAHLDAESWVRRSPSHCFQHSFVTAGRPPNDRCAADGQAASSNGRTRPVAAGQSRAADWPVINAKQTYTLGVRGGKDSRLYRRPAGHREDPDPHRCERRRGRSFPGAAMSGTAPDAAVRLSRITQR